MLFSTTSFVVGLVAFAATANAADGDSCSTEGQITCNSDNTWSVCGSGSIQNMGQVAAGMACVDGNMVAKSSVSDTNAASVATAALAEAMLLESFLQLIAGQLDTTQEHALVQAAEFELAYVPSSLVPPSALPNGTAPDTAPPVSSFVAGTAPVTTPFPTAATTAAPVQNTTTPVVINVGGKPVTISSSNVQARSYPVQNNSLQKRKIVCLSISIWGTKQYVCW